MYIQTYMLRVLLVCLYMSVVARVGKKFGINSQIAQGGAKCSMVTVQNTYHSGFALLSLLVACKLFPPIDVYSRTAHKCLSATVARLILGFGKYG